VSIAFWSWVCVTVMLVLGEALTGGLLILPWAIGAAVATVLEAFHAPSGWIWGSFAVVSVIAFAVIQRAIRRNR
jgi:membrane protein implicated in regulation of membrane protease activity